MSCDSRGNGACRVIRRTGGNERGGRGALTGDEDITGRRGGGGALGGGRRGEVAAPPQCVRWLQRASGKPRFAPAARRARPAPPRSAPSRRPPRSPARVEEGRLVAPDLQRQQRSCGRRKTEEKGRLAALQAEEGGRAAAGELRLEDLRCGGRRWWLEETYKDSPSNGERTGSSPA
ncbi:hypothetical protein PVAP13_7KG073900 [Panicum virgatum]|uniref:Uncharacterized protein n=1 Tax=Panicum virgatum TaxID=38727 RepID=A0A8T0Q907_PANVG|nr:hypothetical protein PVAP13_7KG073900 [Panicum virgatum]